MRLSKNLTLAEAIKSNTAIKNGIDNYPSVEQIENLKEIATKIFQPVRNHIKKPLAVTSGYRSVVLNKKKGGSATSQHCKGEALDLDADVFGYSDNNEVFKYIKDNLEFDQLIAEFHNGNNAPAWIHVSYKKNNNRRQILIAEKVDGETKYVPFTAYLYKEIYGVDV